MNIILKSTEIRDILKIQWPQLNQIWMFDHKYICISKAEVENIISIVWQKISNAGEKLDCDEQALFLHAAIKKYWAKHYSGTEALAFGEVAGIKFNAWPAAHNQNISIDDNKNILLIESQTKNIWIANKKDDQPYWIRF